MRLEFEPAAAADEVAAVLAALDALEDGVASAAEAPARSRWRQAARSFDDGDALGRR